VDLKECLSFKGGGTGPKWFMLDKSEVECMSLQSVEHHPYCPVITGPICKRS